LYLEEKLPARLIAEKYGVSRSHVETFLKRLGVVFRPKGTRPPNIEIKKFYPVDTEEVAYLLGFLWADGYVFKTVRDHSRIGMEIISQDMEDVEKIFSFVGEWSTHDRFRKGRKPQTAKNCGSDPLYVFLAEVGYLNRTGSHSQVLDTLSDELKPFWLRGFFDGDGCLYLPKKGRQGQVGFSSGYEQDWSGIEELINTVGCHGTVSRRIAKNGNKHSLLVLTGNENTIRLLNYIYGSRLDIGLSRKREKYLEYQQR
jgi:hypothetical protein